MATEKTSDRDWTCTVICSVIAVLGAVLFAALLRQVGGFGWNATVFLGGAVAVLGAWLLSQNLCGVLTPPKGPGNVDAAPAPEAKSINAPPPVAPTVPTAATAGVATGTILPGEAELSERGGEWRYEGAADAPASFAEGDYDKDGVVEGTDEGVKPMVLEAAREGGPDDLKQIKGVGPKLEGMLHGLGFYHFDQVANWTPDEVAWVDANLEGFKGRVSRDNWVSQAKVLAGGGSTEFSERVADGDVYN
ncbi:MAG: endonuclease [Pseudomonadota bacterium]